MIDIEKLSSRYKVRVLDEADTDKVLALCLGNPQFYEYTQARPTREEIRNDMEITPPGTARSAKYYVGFFEGQDLVAVMDLIDGYPDPSTAYIGFFMLNPRYQGRQIGTAIIEEAASFLRLAGKRALRLAIDKGNPQSTHFWQKNGFEIVSEADVDGWTKLVARRPLPDRIIAACGNDCAACPRYTGPSFAKTQEELQRTALNWMRIGYRDRIESSEEISCPTGCRPENWCRYRVVKCCEDRRIRTCAACPDYPCRKLRSCFKATMFFEPKCRMVCTKEEYGVLKRAFFEKKENLDSLASSRE